MTTPTKTRPYKVVLAAGADRDVWLAARRHGIGSSDVAAALGVSPRGAGPLGVYHDKRGVLPLDDDAGEAALWGTIHEDNIAREWARRNRASIRRVGLIAARDADHHRCTLDRLVRDCPQPHHEQDVCALEVKSRSAWLAGKWNRRVPDDVLAQVLWQLHVTGMDHVHVAVLIGGNDYRQFTVHAKDHRTVIADIVTAVDNLWAAIQAGTPPVLLGSEHPDDVADLYDQLHPHRTGLTHVAGDAAMTALELVRAYEVARLTESAAAKAKKAARNDLVALMGDGDALVVGDEPVPSVRYEDTTRDGDPLVRTSVDMARLAEEFPDAFEACTKTTPYRRFVVDRAKRLTAKDVNL